MTMLRGQWVGLRAEAVGRSLRVLSALQQKLPGDEGKLAANSSDATANTPGLDTLGLPAEKLLDPFNGKPLIVKRTARGWLIYSVGKNLMDDGGQFENDLDVGVGPPTSHDAGAKSSPAPPEQMDCDTEGR